jgi:hypothetical protein
MPRLLLPLTLLLLASLACGQSAVAPFPDPTYTPEASIFESDRTAYGFFPTPPEVSLDSLFAHYRAMGQHADVSLVQEVIPWADFVNGIEVESQKITDLQNARALTLANNLDSIYIVDPLNGLNRREFAGLPAGWEASFANPDVRAAYKNYTLRLVRELQPRYLGLASEINTYMEAHPEDAENFLSLYRETYAAVKAESPETQVFVTFQWEQVNGLAGTAPGTPRQLDWAQVEIFEPQLDLWVISSYPFVAYRSAAEIPVDYYAPLLARTDKPLAVAEGGFVSRQTGHIPGSPQDQVDYLNAIQSQIGGPRLKFWIYLLLSDLNETSYKKFMRQQGIKEEDITTLGFFVNVGLFEKDGQTPKPALALWDSYRQEP